jgi:hypothetical protein
MLLGFKIVKGLIVKGLIFKGLRLLRFPGEENVL